MALIGEMQYLTIGEKTYSLPSGGGGSVTSVGVNNATNGGLTISGSPITSSGSITIGHSNILTSAQTTQAVYPIKIDKNGHISAYGSAVTSMPASDVYSWAKASSKPSYNFSEIGNTPTTISGYGITDALTIGTTATTAAAGNHTHTTSLTTDTGTSTVTLASAGKYKLTAGGTSVIFTMPTIPTVSYPVTSVNTKTGAVTLSASDVGAAASSHSHGNIQSGGTLQTSDITIASGDKLVVTDSSDSSKVARTSVSFDGSTTNKYLSPKGTWESLPQGTAYQAGTGLSLSGTTFNHSNSVTAQTTSAVYPITIDAQGHIDSIGTAVTIPSITLNGSSSTSPSFYAPTSAGTNGYVLKSNGSGAPSWISATLTDQNVKTSVVTAATTIYLAGSTSSTASTSDLSKHASAAFYVTANSGTSGYTQLRLGNTTATSSAGGKEGQIRLYGTGATYYLDLKPGAITSSNKTITFPNATGTVALTSDLSSFLSSASLTGTYNSTTKDLTLSITTS